MIGRLRGIVAYKAPPWLVVDVNGVGYELEAPMSTFYDLPELGREVTHDLRADVGPVGCVLLVEDLCLLVDPGDEVAPVVGDDDVDVLNRVEVEDDGEEEELLEDGEWGRDGGGRRTRSRACSRR